MQFIRFLSDREGVLRLPINGSSLGDAEFAIVKEDTPITLANVYFVSEYDMINLQGRRKELIDSGVSSIERIDASKVTAFNNFPQIINSYSKLDLNELGKDNDSSQNFLIVDGLGINVLDIIYRSAAWRGLRKALYADDFIVNLDFKASLPFSKYEKLILNNGVSDKVLFGPVSLYSLLEYDYLVTEPLFGSLNFSHSESFMAQVSCPFSGLKGELKVDRLKLDLEPEFPDLIVDKVQEIKTSKGAKKVALINGVSEFKHQAMPLDVQKRIAKILSDKGYAVLVMGELNDGFSTNIANSDVRLSTLSVFIDSVDLLVTTNNPSFALACGNGTPTVLFSVGSIPGLYETQEMKCVEKPVIEGYELNLNKIQDPDIDKINENWSSLTDDALTKLIDKA